MIMVVDKYLPGTVVGDEVDFIAALVDGAVSVDGTAVDLAVDFTSASVGEAVDGTVVDAIIVSVGVSVSAGCVVNSTSSKSSTNFKVCRFMIREYRFWDI